MDELLSKIERAADGLDIGFDLTAECQPFDAEILKAVQERLGITQGELAKRIGTDATYLSRIITGKANMGVEIVRGVGRTLREARRHRP